MICRTCDFANAEATEGDRCPYDNSVLVDEVAALSHEHDLLLGQVVGDEFGLVSVLGVGGFGTVYRAVQFPIRRPVAVKVLHSHFYQNEGIRQRFHQEAKAIGSLTDPTVVKLIRFGEQLPGTLQAGSPGFFFMAQEFIEGRTLHSLIKESGRIVPNRAIGITIQILKALADAHRIGIVHRDLKPANIMVSEDALGGESVKVLDFGIAKVFDDGAQDDADTPVTMTGIMLGTPNYMSPEQTQNVDIRPTTDLYAAAVILFEMLSGMRPFQRPNRRAILIAQRIDDVPELPSDVQVPRSVFHVIKKALSKDPAKRFQTAREMAETLRRAMLNPESVVEESTAESNFEFLGIETMSSWSDEPRPSSIANDRSQETSVDDSSARLAGLGSTAKPSVGHSESNGTDDSFAPGSAPSQVNDFENKGARSPAVRVFLVTLIIGSAIGLAMMMTNVRQPSQTTTPVAPSTRPVSIPTVITAPVSPKVEVKPDRKAVVTPPTQPVIQASELDASIPEKPRAAKVDLGKKHTVKAEKPKRRRRVKPRKKKRIVSRQKRPTKRPKQKKPPIVEQTKRAQPMVEEL